MFNSSLFVLIHENRGLPFGTFVCHQPCVYCCAQALWNTPVGEIQGWQRRVWHDVVIYQTSVAQTADKIRRTGHVAVQ